MEARVKQLEEEHKELEKRVSKIEGDKQLQEFQYKTIMETLQELKIDVKELKETPSRRWDLIITGSITAIIGALVAFFGSRL